MRPKVFLDANVILDLMLKRNSYSDCELIFGMLLSKEITGFVTPSVIQVTSHWLNKAFGPETAKKFLLDMLDEIEVIEVKRSVIIKALRMQYDDIEDNVQYCTALHYHMDYFITNDTDILKQKWAGVSIMSPKDFLNKVKR
ncbi:MAG: PIN domain-containing protein [Niabella sp.]